MGCTPWSKKANGSIFLSWLPLWRSATSPLCPMIIWSRPLSLPFNVQLQEQNTLGNYDSVLRFKWCGAAQREPLHLHPVPSFLPPISFDPREGRAPTQAGGLLTCPPQFLTLPPPASQSALAGDRWWASL